MMAYEKLCLFCIHFRWMKEEMWGMGSTLTGPMFHRGETICKKGHGKEWDEPENEKEYRQIILTAETCNDYEQVKI